jgi:Spy/CpxP family protein refolding chaperone
MTELVQAVGVIAAATISAIAAVFAAKSERNSRPVSNGFAEGLRHDVREIRAMMIQHLNDHAKD